MKKSLLTSLMVALTFFAFSQSNKEEIDLVQSVFGMEKKAMAAEFIKLEGAPKDAFWVAYDEYETKRKELGKKRIALLNKYVEGYSSMDDATMEQITKEIISLQGETDKLIVTYYNKIKKGSGVKPAAQFYQFENYILSKIRAEVMENIPLIGEFDK
jgi:putative cell wall-binding protein